MQIISSYLVKISVNVVYYCTIITWHKIVIDNCFCDGQSSKGNNSTSKNDRVTIFALCTLTHVGYRADTIFVLHKVPRKITQKVYKAELPFLHSACHLMLIDICI